MAKDVANIFKLSKNELARYEGDPFWDAFESTLNFADELQLDIETKETPHILLLEGSYGSGKTFFSTRFTKFLEKSFETIYFSAWENDYLPDPFLAFSKAILSHFKSKNDESEEVEQLFNFFEKFISSLRIGVSPATIDAKAFLDAFRDNDPVLEFKEELKKYILNLDKPQKKLVIIVDELDRCRPDYAMKVLEITKHFFDIEGIFVIIPTNKLALKRSLQALYGIDPEKEEHNSKIECYYTKFFDAQRTIPEPNYKKTISSLLTEAVLHKAIAEGRLNNDPPSDKGSEVFNNRYVLIEKMAEYCKQGEFSQRQTKHLCEEIKDLCNNFYEPVRCEYLAYLICNKERGKKIGNGNVPLKLALSQEHPYAHENVKTNALNINSLINSVQEKYRLFSNKGYSGYLYTQQFFRSFEQFHTKIKREHKTYADFDASVNEIKSKLKGYIENAETWVNKEQADVVINSCNELLDRLYINIQRVEDFKAKYDGDDNTEGRKIAYQAIVANPNTIWSYNGRSTLSSIDDKFLEKQATKL